MRSATRPVLLVTEAFREPKRVLFAFDGSSVTRKGVDMLAASPLLRGLQLQLLTAGESGTADSRSLDAAVSTLSASGIEASASVRPGSPKEVIAGALAEGGIDMLVMGRTAIHRCEISFRQQDDGNAQSDLRADPVAALRVSRGGRIRGRHRIPIEARPRSAARAVSRSAAGPTCEAAALPMLQSGLRMVIAPRIWPTL